MASASASSSSSAAAPSSKSKKRRWTREQLLRHLDILGPLSAPLPPTLPPSPPASRSASPAPPPKRKSDSSSDYRDNPKRPRTSERPRHPLPHQHRPSSSTSSVMSAHSNAQAPTPRSNNPPMSEPCEDGEVTEEPAPAPSSSASTSTPSSVPALSRGPPADSATSLPTTDPDPIANFTPIHRPRRGRPATRYFDDLHDKFHKYGRMLKYSGDSRFWSTYPSTHKEYRPLPNPPPPTSPYHKHGGLIARLELLDALVCFTYSTWMKDYGRRVCDISTWATMDPFLKWCKHKWSAEDGYNDAERALQGLIYMIEGFILSRKMVYSCKTAPGQEVKRLHQEMSSNMMAAAREAKTNPSGISAPGGINGSGLLPPSTHQGTPPMLPSPASIATASSANSTPTNNSGGASRSSTLTSSSSGSHQPNGAMHNRQPPTTVPQPTIPQGFLPDSMRNNYKSIPPHVVKAMASVTSTVSPPFVQDITDLVMMMNASSSLLGLANQMLNLPIVRKSFPRTYARMVYSTLSPNEEYEPEFEDEDGELFWPGQSIGGEGLGWVCLMGKAMIVEFGKSYGYVGLAGVVPKPEPGEEKGRR